MKAGHGGGDFFTNHYFAEAIRSGRQPYLDVYRGVAMSVVGILAWKSVLDRNSSYDVPDFSHESSRRKWEHDTWCPMDLDDPEAPPVSSAARTGAPARRPRRLEEGLEADRVQGEIGARGARAPLSGGGDREDGIHVRLGVVGGRRGGAFNLALQTLREKVTLCAVCDLSPEVLARWKSEHPGVKTFASYEDMLGSDSCNAVFVATPSLSTPLRPSRPSARANTSSARCWRP